MSTATAKKKAAKKKATRKKPPLIARTDRQKRDKKLVEIILKNPEMPINEAMMKAGFSESTANKQSKRTVEKSSIQTPIIEALNSAGVTEERLAKKISNGLDCQRVIAATVIHKDKDGKTEQINDFIEVDDNQAQHKYVDTALKLKKSYPDDKEESDKPIEVTVNLIDYAKVKDGGQPKK